MQVHDVDGVEGLCEFFPHAAENLPVEKSVVADVGHDALPIPLDVVLPQPDELDVVIAEGVDGPLAQVALVVGHQPLYPLAPVAAGHIVGRVAEHHHHPPAALDDVGLLRLPVDEGGELPHAGGILQRVGEVDPEPLAPGRGVAGLAQQQLELEVRDGVGGHQDLEPQEAGEQVRLHVLRPRALAAPELRVDLPDHLGQEGAGARGGVEYPHAVLRAAGEQAAVGQPLREPEIAPQQAVHRPHHEADDGERRVPHPPHLALGGVVGPQEVLVEVDEGIPLRPRGRAFPHHPGGVGLGERLREVLHQPGDPRLRVHHDEVEE